MNEDFGQETAESEEAASLTEAQPEDIIHQAKEAVRVMRQIDKLRRKKALVRNKAIKVKKQNRATNRSARKARRKNNK